VFVFGNVLGAVAWLVDLVFNVLMLVILVNALLSWFRFDTSHPAVVMLDRISDAVCNPIRRMFPTVTSGIDFAPMIAMVALIFLQRIIVPSLQTMAARMG
jgi:YggT family protein